MLKTALTFILSLAAIPAHAATTGWAVQTIQLREEVFELAEVTVFKTYVEDGLVYEDSGTTTDLGDVSRSENVYGFNGPFSDVRYGKKFKIRYSWMPSQYGDYGISVTCHAEVSMLCPAASFEIEYQDSLLPSFVIFDWNLSWETYRVDMVEGGEFYYSAFHYNGYSEGINEDGDRFEAFHRDYGLYFDVTKVRSKEWTDIAPVPVPAGALLLPFAILSFGALRKLKRDRRIAVTAK